VKRSLALLAALASLVLAASPVSASTESYHFTDRGSGLVASWTNVPWDQMEIPAGTYWEVDVDASSSVTHGTKTYANGVCVTIFSITFDTSGNGFGIGYGYCGDAAALTVDNKLNGGYVAGTIDFYGCTTWDENGNCTNDEAWHTLGVDLSVSGTGPLYRSHGTSSGGAQGFYHYTSHGTEIDREGVIASADITLDGASIIADSASSSASLFDVKSGETDVFFCRPTLGC
jgi:hypothetical protein